MKYPVTFIVQGLQYARMRLINDDTGATIQLSQPIRIQEFGILRHEFVGLSADTKYRVQVETVAGQASPFVARFKTPLAGAHSFTFAAGSCSDTQSNALIFDNLRTRAEAGDLDFFVHMGDMHYRDEDRNDEKWFQRHFREVFAQQRQRDCWSALPMIYMWDDHDFGPNDSARDNPARQAAIAAYRRTVPSPQLVRTGPEDAPYYAFTRGRVRFVVPDCRSERAPKGLYPTTDPRQVVWTDEQKAWFFEELTSAQANNQAVVWVQTKRWNGTAVTGGDTWAGYDAARQEVISFITAESLTDRLVMIAGDMHAIAYDDGTNTGGFKLCHAAPIDKGATSSGPFTTASLPLVTSARALQYGLFDVTDTGGADIGIRFRGMQVDIDTGAETEGIDVSFDLDAA